MAQTERTMQVEVLGRGTVRLGIQHKVDPTVAVQIHDLRPMPPRVVKSQHPEEARQLGSGRLVDGEFQELHAVEIGHSGQASGRRTPRPR